MRICTKFCLFLFSLPPQEDEEEEEDDSDDDDSDDESIGSQSNFDTMEGSDDDVGNGDELQNIIRSLLRRQ